MENPTSHHIINNGAPNSQKYYNIKQIHRKVDNIASFAIQPAFLNSNYSNIKRLIDDTNENGVWDAGESIQYVDSENTTISDSIINFKFQAERVFSEDDNPLRIENLHYWIGVLKIASSEDWF